jgi:hypothetical protein
MFIFVLLVITNQRDVFNRNVRYTPPYLYFFLGLFFENKFGGLDYFIYICPMKDLIHYMPSERSYNVRCLNGSAHVRRTNDIKVVTCPLCLDESTNVRFWYHNGKKIK